MRKILVLACLLTAFAVPPASAADSTIEITSPADGAKLDAMEQNRIEYSVTLGSGADHIHVYVDGKEAALLRQVKGSYTMETLTLGDHDVCIKLVNKNHTPIGVQRCIKVSVE
jgi:hypothetical protein